jgi:hypothetical protein
MPRAQGALGQKGAGHEPVLHPIELLDGAWGSRYPDLQGRPTVMKTIRLEQARWIEPTERVTLHVGHPQQGTINRWHLGELTVRNLVEGIQTEPGLGKKVFSGRSQLPSLYLQDN